jgi:ComF family protein
MATPGLDDRWPHGHMRAAIRRALAACADIVVPPSCLVCRTSLEEHHVLCAACWREVHFIRAPLCDVLGIPLPFDTGERTVSAGALARPPAYDRARAVAHFSGSMRTLVHHFKYADRHDARALFGRWLAEAGRELLDGADVLVPVPLTRWRLLARRFNQAAILAHELSRQVGLGLDTQLLQRGRFTKTQVGLTHDQRRRNVAGAFNVTRGRRASLQGRNVLLVDDVITTGATAEACARALKRAGAARVDVLALALVTGEADCRGSCAIPVGAAERFTVSRETLRGAPGLRFSRLCAALVRRYIDEIDVLEAAVRCARTGRASSASGSCRCARGVAWKRIWPTPRG